MTLAKTPEEMKIEALKRALDYACTIIRNYQADIRHGEERVGVDLVVKGFCQGEAYLKALEDIERKASDS